MIALAVAAWLVLVALMLLINHRLHRMNRKFPTAPRRRS